MKLSIVLAALLALSLSACTERPNEPAPPAPAPVEQKPEPKADCPVIQPPAPIAPAAPKPVRKPVKPPVKAAEPARRAPEPTPQYILGIRALPIPMPRP